MFIPRFIPIVALTTLALSILASAALGQATFQGTLTGAIKEVSPDGRFCILSVEKADPPAPTIIGTEQRIMVNYQTLTQPNVDEAERMKAFKTGETVSIAVRSTPGGLRFALKDAAAAGGNARDRTDASNLQALPVQAFIDAIPKKLTEFDPSKVNGAVWKEPASAAVIHVAPGGIGDGSSEAKPVGTLAEAVTLASAKLTAGESARIQLAAGRYREGGIEISGKGWADKNVTLVIQGAGADQSVLTGSDEWKASEWTSAPLASGSGQFYSHDWAYQFGNDGGPWGKNGPKKVIAHRSEMVFINGVPLRQVLLENYKYTWPEGWGGKGTHTFQSAEDPAKALEPGTFGVLERPEQGGKIFFSPPAGLDLAGARIEVAVRRGLLRFVDVSNVALRGVGFEHSASPIKGDSAVTFTAPINLIESPEFRNHNILIEDCSFRWNNGRGLTIDAVKGLTLRRNDASYNGFSGITGWLVADAVWEDNRTNFNNWRGYLSDWVRWAIGGVKMHWMYHARFTRHESVGNFTRGVWFDVDVSNVLVEDSIVVGNVVGLFMEVSTGPFLIRRCLLADDAVHCLLIANAGNVTVEDTLIVGSDIGSVITFSTGRRSMPNGPAFALGEAKVLDNVVCSTGPIRFVNNLVVNPAGPIIIAQGDGNPEIYAHVLKNSFKASGNVYSGVPAPTFGTKFQKSTLVDFDQWKAETGDSSRVAEITVPGRAQWDFQPADTIGLSLGGPKKVREEMVKERDWFRGFLESMKPDEMLKETGE